mmetsp:Transcript_20002/g.30666  ORF Transcript_20002/g.30666 Transcript_20002/m.30666 type:complete len:107 (-) Transcript_20002:59-379(-)
MAVLIAFVLCMLLVVLALEEEEWNGRASISVKHHLVQGNDIIAVVGAAVIIIVVIIALLLTCLHPPPASVRSPRSLHRRHHAYDPTPSTIFVSRFHHFAHACTSSY